MDLKRPSVVTRVAALTVALIGQSVGVFFLDSAVERTVLVLGLALAVIWAAAGINAEATTADEAHQSEARRFLKLRGAVDRVLTDVRTMNWIAVDARLKFKDDGDAHREMNDVEHRLSNMLAAIRDFAGVEEEAWPALMDAEEDPPGIEPAKVDGPGH